MTHPQNPSTSDLLADLLSRVRAATGRDRKIDILIDQRVDPEGRIVEASSLENAKRALEYFENGYVCEQCGQPDRSQNPLRLPRYTGDVSACVALAERVLPGSGLSIRWSDRFAASTMQVKEGDIGSPVYTERAATPALAMLAAILSALIALPRKDKP